MHGGRNPKQRALHSKKPAALTLPYVDHLSSFLVSGFTSTTLYGILWKSRNALSWSGTARDKQGAGRSHPRRTLLQNGQVAY